MNIYRVEVNAFGNAFNVEQLAGSVWVPVIQWLSEEVARAWRRRLARLANMTKK